MEQQRPWTRAITHTADLATRSAMTPLDRLNALGTEALPAVPGLLLPESVAFAQGRVSPMMAVWCVSWPRHPCAGAHWRAAEAWPLTRTRRASAWRPDAACAQGRSGRGIALQRLVLGCHVWRFHGQQQAHRSVFAPVPASGRQLSAYERAHGSAHDDRDAGKPYTPARMPVRCARQHRTARA